MLTRRTGIRQIRLRVNDISGFSPRAARTAIKRPSRGLLICGGTSDVSGYCLISVCVRRVRSNNPEKIYALKTSGLEVVARMALELPLTGEIVFLGDVSAQHFLAFYVKGNRVLEVAGMNCACDVAAVEGLMRDDRTPTPDQLRNGIVNFPELLRNPS